MYIFEKGLSYQRLILIVQEKPDCPVQKSDYPIFTGLKHLDRTYPFTVFSLLSHTRTTVRVTLRPPLAIPWFLSGILEFLGKINSPRIGALFPQPVFPS
jgi:hypothetical protein